EVGGDLGDRLVLQRLGHRTHHGVGAAVVGVAVHRIRLERVGQVVRILPGDARDGAVGGGGEVHAVARHAGGQRAAELVGDVRLERRGNRAVGLAELRVIGGDVGDVLV